ncbi:MAG: PAS domain S-box protein [Bacteroidota bacterium]
MHNKTSDKDPQQNFRVDMQPAFAAVLDSGELLALNTILRRENEELKKDYTELKELFEKIDEVLYSVDMVSYKVTRMSAICEKVYGYSPAEFLADGNLWQKVIHPEDKHLADQQLSSLYQGKQICNQYRIIRKDKSIRWIENKIIPALNAAGELIRLDGVTNDISGRKNSETAFEIERNRVNKFFAEAPSCMGILKGPDHIFEMANPLYLQMIGKDDIIGKPVRTVLPEIVSQGFIDLLDGVYKTGITFSANEMLIQLDKKGNGELDGTYLNFVYQAYNNNEGATEGIFFFAIDVTEQVVLRKKIEESEQRYRQIVETAQEGIWLIDENNVTTLVNRKMADILEYSVEEMMGKKNYLFMDEESREKATGHIVQRKLGINENHDFKYRTKSGKDVWTNLSTNPVFTDGIYKGALAMVTDISDRKHAEDQIRENEFRYRSLFEQANDAICISDSSLKFYDMNPSGCRMLGYSKEELLQLSAIDLFFQEDLKENPFRIDDLNAGKAIRSDRRIKRKDGVVIEVDLSGKLLEDGRFIMFARDVSERNQAEKLVKERELHFRSLIEQATDAICIADDSLRFIEMNSYACEFLGYTKEEALQLFVTDVLFPEDLAANPIDRFGTITSREIIRNERRFKRKDGSSVIMEVSTRMMEDGKFIMFGHDVSERKEAEEAIRRSEARLDMSNKELELKNKELEHFAYIASHDLQEPLRTTSSFVKLLQQHYKGKPDEKADKYLNFIADSSERMKILITDLLDYSRIGNKRELQEVDCNKILNELLQDLDVVLKETGAVISVDALPVISGNRTEIKQLFQNLVVNAIKFRKKDTAPHVYISASKNTDHWNFTIRDNGIGIAKDHTDRIFVIFQRLHTRTEYEGSGIGLAHCKKIIGLHGGDIRVESTPGEGATFHFNIPLIHNL